jgi:ERCC4-type nuclease
MNIILDDRENALLENMKSSIISQPIFQNINLSKKQLPLGDIIISRKNTETNSFDNNINDLILIERKTVSDLLSSIKDGRYEEQSHRLIHASGFPKHNIFYVIEGSFSFLKPAEKQILYSAITSLAVFKGFSVYHTGTIQETGEWILYMADKIRRDFEKGKIPYFSMKSSINPSKNCSTDIVGGLIEDVVENTVEPAAYSGMVKKVKRDNITPENIGEILLCQIPGFSSLTAKAVINKFDGSFTKLISVLNTPEAEGLFKDIVLENGKEDGKKGRKISKACIASLFKFLRDN